MLVNFHKHVKRVSVSILLSIISRLHSGTGKGYTFSEIQTTYFLIDLLSSKTKELKEDNTLSVIIGDEVKTPYRFPLLGRVVDGYVYMFIYLFN